jgi:hypothetical protein
MLIESLGCLVRASWFYGLASAPPSKERRKSRLPKPPLRDLRSMSWSARLRGVRHGDARARSAIPFRRDSTTENRRAATTRAETVAF